MTERRILLDLREDPLFPLFDEHGQSAYVSQKLTDMIIEDGKTKEKWTWGDKLIVKALMPEVIHPIQVTVDFNQETGVVFTREILFEEFL